MFLFIFFPITYQTLIMVFVAYEPPWMCTANSTACLQPNATGREIFSTATKPIALYDRRCSLNRSDWKFADYELYEGPHSTIVTQVRNLQSLSLIQIAPEILTDKMFSSRHPVHH
jgi:OCT family organic cation transporter-like MFS transporter 4/5